MKKFENLGDLLKSWVGHFKKAAGINTDLAKHHGELAILSKAKHEGMADDDAMKQYFVKAEGLNTKLADLYKAQAESFTEVAETELSEKALADVVDISKAAAAKAAADKVAADDKKCDHGKLMKEACTDCKREAATEKAAGNSVSQMIDETKTALVKKAMESLTEDPEVASSIRKMVLAEVQKALGDKIVPDHVRGVLSDNPTIAVPRAGQPTPATPNEQLAPELQGMFN